MNRKGEVAKVPANAEEPSNEWERRPGGMLVQKRDPDANAAHAGPLINLRVFYGLMCHHISITSNSTFGDLKKLLVQGTGLQPRQQQIQYKGRERNDHDVLREVGLKDKSKVIIVEDIAGSEKRLIETRKADAIAKACKAIDEVQQLVDKTSAQVVAVESAVNQGKKPSENEFTGLIDVFMSQLLKLDASKVDGNMNVKKRILVRRIQKYVETLDALSMRENHVKSQSEVPRMQISSASPHFKNSAKLVATNNASKASAQIEASKADSSTWENFGSNHSMKVAPQMGEPMLIKWD